MTTPVLDYHKPPPPVKGTPAIALDLFVLIGGYFPVIVLIRLAVSAAHHGNPSRAEFLYNAVRSYWTAGPLVYAVLLLLSILSLGQCSRVLPWNSYSSTRMSRRLIICHLLWIGHCLILNRTVLLLIIRSVDDVVTGIVVGGPICIALAFHFFCIISVYLYDPDILP